MSYQMGYDPVAYAAYMDASGTGMDAVDVNGMTIGGAPANGALTARVQGSYGFSVGSSATGYMVLALVAGAYLLLHFDRVKGAVGL